MSVPLVVFTPVTGFLDEARVVTRASTALANKLHRKDSDSNAKAIEDLADLLPRILAVESLSPIKLESVDTFGLMVISSAVRATMVRGSFDRVTAIAQILSDVQVDLIKASHGDKLPPRRLKELRQFCLALADSLLEQAPIPQPPDDTRRV